MISAPCPSLLELRERPWVMVPEYTSSLSRYGSLIRMGVRSCCGCCLTDPMEVTEEFALCPESQFMAAAGSEGRCR